MISRLKSMKVVILVLGSFLLVTASPASLVLCKMAMSGCSSPCIEFQKDVSPKTSYEVTCPKDCCLSFELSSNPVVLSESKNISDGKAKSLALSVNQPFLVIDSVNFQRFKFHSLEQHHPAAPQIYLLKSSFLI